MKELTSNIVFSPGATKTLKLKGGPSEIQANTSVEFLYQISNSNPRAVVIAEVNHQKTKEFSRLASTAKESLGTEFSLVLYRKNDGAVPEEFDKQIRSLSELSYI